MREYKYILIGICMMAVVLGLVFFTGAIYDAENKNTIETYFFEPNNKSSDRISAPVASQDIPQNYLREKIVEHFVYEYFYVIPDGDNARARTQDFKNTDGTWTPLYGMAAPVVREQWQTKVAPGIMDLADKYGMRTVELLGVSESESGHLIVDYKLKIWDKPNDVLAHPTETTGRLLLNITEHPIVVKQTQKVLNWLQNGTDPVSAFWFQIQDVVQE